MPLFFHASPALAELEQLDDLEGLIENNNIEEWQFREDIIELPDYPDFEKLKELSIDATQGRLKYFIDPESIKIGRDKVVLATIVITSPRSARNVLLEGYRCDTREYKAYAYGTSNKTFYELHDPQWKVIRRVTGTAQDFRRELVTVYLCDTDRTPLSREEIIRLIDYPGFRDDEERMF